MRDYITCPVCNKPMRAITAQHMRMHGYFSSEKFKSAFGLKYLVCESKRLKQSKLMGKKNPMKGKHHKQESIEKMCSNRAGKGLGVAGTYTRTKEIRDKISKSVVATLKSTLGKNGFWVESEKSISSPVWVRSTWEARVVKILDAHPEVDSVELEPYSIPYGFDGSTRRYIPDILVELLSGLRLLIEVKPKELCIGPRSYARRNRAKIRALGKHTCETPRMIGTVISSEEDIEKLENIFLRSSNA